ncbi:hypothetical protein HYFRA_00004077 [Hymenoscyphus fraxineus]|uniref:Uncharacterized protein n=1 Tax=Hymenoscyphus fraxineus TaxID=746836 RepID=A0A9N9KPI2_9HELO|nr:hypothetical protein HYFRA_00004077 [Hymenoscyphus fraxineus]
MANSSRTDHRSDIVPNSIVSNDPVDLSVPPRASRLPLFPDMNSRRVPKIHKSSPAGGNLDKSAGWLVLR